MAEGLIFDIQHFSVNDGPGIRTLVFFKGCPLNCEWCCNPESQSFKSQLRYIEFKCKKCFSCIDSCPFGAITEESDKLLIDFSRCTFCKDKKCTDVCNYGALSTTGEKYTVEKLVSVILKDIEFYKNSGGGVTFSGGEPLSQPDFLLKTLKECKTHGIHTAVETCGFANKRVLREIMPFTDLFLYDIKIINNIKHLKHTGKPNDTILSNIEFLAKSGANLIIRVPLIRGINDDKENLNLIAEMAKSIGVKEINIEPYHSLGEDKYHEFGIKPKLSDVRMFDNSEILETVSLFLKAGLKCSTA